MRAKANKLLWRQTTLPQATETTPQVRRVCVINFILCLGVVPMSFVFANKAMTFHYLYVAGAVLSIISLVASVMGILKSTPGVVWSLMLAVAAAYGLLCTGGLCLLYLPYLSAELTSATDKQYAKSVIASSALASQATTERTYLLIGGIAQLILGLLAAYMVRQLFFVLGEKRASVALLQSFSAFMIPLSLLFIAGGQYIISSQTFASSPYTGIFIYVCGLLELVLSLLAFIGSGFEYRRLLNTFSWFAFVTAILAVGAAIACLSVTSSVKTSVINNWSTIRVILPPTLQARYDQTQFALFIQRNLYAMSYIAIVSGLLMILLSFAAQSLREIMNVIKRRAAQDKRCALDPEVHPEFVARREWTLMFKSSKRNQRICMRVTCGFAAVLIVAITVVMTLSVIFTTQCASISKAHDVRSALLGSNTSAACSTIRLRNEYASGKLQVVAGTSDQGNATFEHNAVSSKYLTSSGFSTHQMGSTCVVDATPGDAPTFLWFDTSCQVANLLVALPALANTSSPRPAIEMSSNTSAIDINLLQNGTKVPVAGLTISTDQANVNIYGAAISSGGLSVVSTSGEVNISTIVVNATGPLGAKTPTTISSSLGSVVLTNSSLIDSPLSIATDVSGILIQSVATAVTHGHTSVELTSSTGGIVVSKLDADWVALKTSSGAIIADGLVSNGNGALVGRIDVQSIGGSVRLTNTAAQGYVHVETNSGNVVVQLASSTFSGLYYIRSEYGRVRVRTGNTTYDTITRFTTSDPREAQGLINCGTSCHYVGDLYIRTVYGDVDVQVGCASASYQLDKNIMRDDRRRALSIEKASETAETPAVTSRRSKYFDVACIQRLNLSSANIGKLALLDTCTSLVELNLSKNHIASIRGIPTLAALRVLDCSFNEIPSLGITFVSKFHEFIDDLALQPQLEELHVEGNEIKHVDFVKLQRQVPRLRRLFLHTSTAPRSNPGVVLLTVCKMDNYHAVIQAAMPSLEYLDGEILVLRQMATEAKSKPTPEQDADVEQAIQDATWEKVSWELPRTNAAFIMESTAKLRAMLADCNRDVDGDALDLLRQMQAALQ
ncbi:hypothetical protein AeMF1_010136 [Aphanomyces euteiches]|nr:hypothetical protein AeMF1_010136 [Aphanomyces euteiches]